MAKSAALDQTGKQSDSFCLSVHFLMLAFFQALLKRLSTLGQGQGWHSVSVFQFFFYLPKEALINVSAQAVCLYSLTDKS